jgi:hypothetical protein
MRDFGMFAEQAFVIRAAVTRGPTNIFLLATTVLAGGAIWLGTGFLRYTRTQPYALSLALVIAAAAVILLLGVLDYFWVTRNLYRKRRETIGSLVGIVRGITRRVGRSVSPFVITVEEIWPWSYKLRRSPQAYRKWRLKKANKLACMAIWLSDGRVSEAWAELGFNEVALAECDAPNAKEIIALAEEDLKRAIHKMNPEALGRFPCPDRPGLDAALARLAEMRDDVDLAVDLWLKAARGMARNAVNAIPADDVLGLFSGRRTKVVFPETDSLSSNLSLTGALHLANNMRFIPRDASTYRRAYIAFIRTCPLPDDVNIAIVLETTLALSGLDSNMKLDNNGWPILNKNTNSQFDRFPDVMRRAKLGVLPLRIYLRTRGAKQASQS